MGKTFVDPKYVWTKNFIQAQQILNLKYFSDQIIFLTKIYFPPNSFSDPILFIEITKTFCQEAGISKLLDISSFKLCQ